MTKHNLEVIRDNERSINAMRLELEALRYKASGVGAIRYDKDRVQVSPQDYMTMALADVLELEKRISEQIDNLEEMKGQAYIIVRKIEAPEQRAIIEWYYLNGLSMIDTAERLNMSERSAYYLREDALKSFESIKE